jgi:hypothetical protein
MRGLRVPRLCWRVMGQSLPPLTPPAMSWPIAATQTRSTPRATPRQERVEEQGLR